MSIHPQGTFSFGDGKKLNYNTSPKRGRNNSDHIVHRHVGRIINTLFILVIHLCSLEKEII